MAHLVFNQMEGGFHVVRVESSEVAVYTHIQSPQSAYLDIKFVIKPVNVLYGEYEVLERTRITDVFYPIRDAYVYEAVPTLNYGARTAIHIGKDRDGNRYRSLIDFDISSLQEDLYITHAQLVLTTTEPLYNLRHFEISTLNRKFYEYDVTWANQPTRDLFIDIIQVDPLQKQIKINVTETIKQWYENKREKNGFVLKEFENLSGELISFYSKEYSLEVCPRLEIEYLDPNFGVSRRKEIPIFSNIQRRKSKDLPIRTNIQPLYGDSDFPIEVFVNNRVELVIELNVSKKEIPIEVSIIRYLESDLPISSRVQQKKLDELDIESIITRKAFPIQYEVTGHRSVPIETKVAKRNLPIELFTSKKTLPIIFHIKDQYDIPITFNISKHFLDIVVNTVKSDTLQIVGRILNKRRSELPILVGLRQPEVLIQTDIVLSSSLNIEIETIGTSELPIRSSIQHSGFRSLDIETDIVANSMLPIETKIKSPLLDIEAHIQVPRSRFFPLQVEIIQYSDLGIELTVAKKSDLFIFVDVEHIWFSDLDVVVTIEGELERRSYVFIF